MAETGNRDRHLCVINTCSWYYERPSGPTSAELERALLVGAEEASRDRALRTDAILREHFETHTLEQWVTALVEQRRRAETAERELAEVRERIGETREEWAYDAPGFFFGPPLLDEANAQRLVSEDNARGGHAVLKRRVVGEWKAADGG